MIPWFLRGLRRGVVTSRFPQRHDPYATSFAGSVQPVEGAQYDQALASLCPTGAIQPGPAGMVVDQGRCILCMRCTDARPDLIEIHRGSRTAQLARAAVVVPGTSESDADVARVRGELQVRTRALRRSVHVRHVDLGSDGSEEWEVLALLNPYYDIPRLGIFFTASPKHADVLLLTGVGAEAMREPLQRTVEATPRPFVVIAAGTDAISGGLVAPTRISTAGAGALLPDAVPVDVWVPGSPPPPFALLRALLLAVGRIPSREEVAS